jgi:hypothetical protein
MPRKRHPPRWMPELAAVLWALLLVVFLLITLPTLGVFPPILPDRLLALLKAAATLIVIVAIVLLVSAVMTEVRLAVVRAAIRRRRSRVRDLKGRR